MRPIRFSLVVLVVAALAAWPAAAQSDRTSDKVGRGDTPTTTTTTTTTTPTTGTDIDFGDDTSEWANDGECDDPRFSGEGSATTLLEADLGHDATDCRTLFDEGKIVLADTPTTTTTTTTAATIEIDGITFGDDTSNWSNDGECDDPRFTGAGSANTLLEDDREHDATDCSTLYQAGRIRLVDAPFDPILSADGSIDFGDNTSERAGNGTCSDARFEGSGVSEASNEDIGFDADDCKSALEGKTASLIAVFHPGYVKGAPYDASGVDFGDNTSSYADNTDCDDPRFIGPGMATILLDDDISHDAADCQAAFIAGTIAEK